MDYRPILLLGYELYLLSDTPLTISCFDLDYFFLFLHFVIHDSNGLKLIKPGLEKFRGDPP